MHKPTASMNGLISVAPKAQLSPMLQINKCRNINAYNKMISLLSPPLGSNINFYHHLINLESLSRRGGLDGVFDGVFILVTHGSEGVKVSLQSICYMCIIIREYKMSLWQQVLVEKI